MNVEVVLATYNGDWFLEQQLESLWHQQLKPSRLLIFDDGSSDSTTTILNDWQKRNPHWIHLLKPLQRRLGPTAAFDHLLRESTAPYVALCDQDDIWHPDRLKTGIAFLQHAEANSPNERKQPLLLHSNAELIDCNGNHCPGTLWSWHGCSNKPPGLVELAQHNTATGCTMLANQALLHHALPISEAAVLHDHWLALVARHNDGLLNCPQKLIAHRRHARNSSGLASHSKQAPGHAFEHHLKKHRQWTSFCDRYQINLQTRLQWWPRSVIHLYKRKDRRKTYKY